MKNIKVLALLVCTAAVFATGCASHRCHKSDGTCQKVATCTKHQCCMDAHTDCAHCPKCSHK